MDDYGDDRDRRLLCFAKPNYFFFLQTLLKALVSGDVTPAPPNRALVGEPRRARKVQSYAYAGARAANAPGLPRGTVRHALRRTGGTPARATSARTLLVRSWTMRGPAGRWRGATGAGTGAARRGLACATSVWHDTAARHSAVRGGTTQRGVARAVRAWHGRTSCRHGEARRGTSSAGGNSTCVARGGWGEMARHLGTRPSYMSRSSEEHDLSRVGPLRAEYQESHPPSPGKTVTGQPL